MRSELSQLVRRSGSGICICHKPKGVQLLRLCISDLREHNFRHNFPALVNRICNYSEDIKPHVTVFPLSHLFLQDINPADCY